MNGIIVLKKEAGYTSMDCCALVRKIAWEKHVGHAGTLDPNATGVLPICLGGATKLIEYMQSSGKSYIATVRFGIETDTQDIWGQVINRQDSFEMPGRDEIELALSSFLGESMQLPPMYSAVRVNGQRLYDLARQGVEIERAARKIDIKSIELAGYHPESLEADFFVSCSKGTFVRTICCELGKKLGLSACMSSLQRTSAAGFDISEAVTLDELREKGAESFLRPAEIAVSFLPRIDLKREFDIKLFKNGQFANVLLKNPLAMYAENPAAVYAEGKLLGIVRGGKVEKILNL